MTTTYYYYHNYQHDQNGVDQLALQDCSRFTIWHLAEQYTVSLFEPNEPVVFTCKIPKYCQSNNITSNPEK